MPENKSSEELKVVRIPEILPVLPLAGAFVFPKMLFPLEVSGEPSMTLIDEAMAGNFCRCGTYLRIREGIRRAAVLAAKKAGEA